MKYDLKEIEEKANYCLNCKVKPCSAKGCPLGNNIPEFIKCVKNKEYEQAFYVLSETTVLQPICGRICPHMKQCQGSCVRGIKGNPVSIGDLEAFVGDMALEKGYEFRKSENKKNKSICVIGGGPSGLTCAAMLAMDGYNVTIYEKYDKLGGILRHGIPEFRLEKELLDKWIEKILNIGIKVEYNKELGKNLSLEDLQNSYDAIYISIGANISTKMGIEGEKLEGVYGGNELLENGNHPNYNGKKVAVIGGGNVAMDTCRTIKRLGAEKVYVIYRRAEEQMPAEQKEIQEAKKEGIEFLFQNNIVKILGDKKVNKIECIKTKLVAKEGETRLSPVNIEGSNYVIDMDYVVMALGSKPEENIISNFEKNKWGYINVDENNRTSIKKVYAGGDIAGEKATVAWAARSGRNTAETIKNDLEN